MALLLAFMVRVQERVPEQAPDQLANCQPEAGAAVKMTEVPEGYVSEQSVPQLMPVPVTVPEPDFETVKVRLAT